MIFAGYAAVVAILFIFIFHEHDSHKTTEKEIKTAEDTPDDAI